MSKLGGEKGFNRLGELIDRGAFTSDMFPAVPVFAGGFAVDGSGKLVQEIKTLQDIIKNKKETSYKMDETGNVIKREVTNGYVKTIKTIRQRPRL
jgi:hypothetical protein